VPQREIVLDLAWSVISCFLWLGESGPWSDNEAVSHGAALVSPCADAGPQLTESP
jgi:hypothetical protein